MKIAPTQQMLADYRGNPGEWDIYAARFQELITQRRIEDMDRDRLAGACLLCSEDQPHHCHRRPIAEYLRDRWRDVDIVHLWRVLRPLTGAAFILFQCRIICYIFVRPPNATDEIV